MSKYNTTEFRTLANSYLQAIEQSASTQNEENNNKIAELLDQPEEVLKGMISINCNPFVAMVNSGLEQEATVLFNKLPGFGKSGVSLGVGLPLAINKKLFNLAKHIISENPEFINVNSLDAAIRINNIEMLQLLLEKGSNFSVDARKSNPIKYAANQAILNDHLEGFKLLLKIFPDVAKVHGADLYYTAINNNTCSKVYSKIGYLKCIDEINPIAYKTSNSEGNHAVHACLSNNLNEDDIGISDLLDVVQSHPDILCISDSKGFLPFDLLCNNNTNSYSTRATLKSNMLNCAISHKAQKIFDPAGSEYTGINYLFEIGNKKAATTALIKKIQAQIELYAELHKNHNVSKFISSGEVTSLKQLFKINTDDCQEREKWCYETKTSRTKVVEKLKPLFSQNFKMLFNLLQDPTVDNTLAEYVVKGCNMLASKFAKLSELPEMMNEATCVFIDRAFSAPGNDTLKGLVLHGAVIENAKNICCTPIIAARVNDWLLNDFADYFISNKICQNILNTPFVNEATAYEVVSYLRQMPDISIIEEVSLTGDVEGS